MKDKSKKVKKSHKSLSKSEIVEKIRKLKTFPLQAPEIKDEIQKLQQLLGNC